MFSPIELPIPLGLKDLLNINLKFSKEQKEEITRLEDDKVKDGEGKVFDVKTGWFKRGKCLVFKDKKKIMLIFINSRMEAKSKTFEM